MCHAPPPLAIHKDNTVLVLPGVLWSSFIVIGFWKSWVATNLATIIAFARLRSSILFCHIKIDSGAESVA